MLGKRVGAIAICGETSEQHRDNNLNSSRVSIPNSASFTGHWTAASRQQTETLTGDGELDPAGVARMRALLDEAV